MDKCYRMESTIDSIVNVCKCSSFIFSLIYIFWCGFTSFY